MFVTASAIPEKISYFAKKKITSSRYINPVEKI